MEKKPLTMKQKIRIFKIGRVISYALLAFGILMDGFANPMTWVGIVLVIAVSVYRVMAIRCPECDELIVSNFGFLSKSCDKCGWNIDKENEPKDENA